MSALFTILLVFLVFSSGCVSEISDSSRSGIILGDEVWSEKIVVTGDVTVPAGVTLTIKPGTKVIFRADYDGTGAGGGHIIDELTSGDPSATPEYTQSHSSLNVEGTLLAAGTPEEKILFTSDSEEPRHTDWDGIRFGPESSGEMKHCVVEWAHTGPALHGTNGVSVTHCEIRHVFWGGLHAFECSPVFEYNVLDDIGHEAFDTHKASPVIRHNTISHSRNGFVFNYHDIGSGPIVFENNTVRDSSNIGLLQENAYAIIKNNTFAGSNDTGGPWHYRGFTLDSNEHSNGLGLADNVNVLIANNSFAGFRGPSLYYERIGPNMGIGHTTEEPEPFEIGEGPVSIAVKGNSFANPADEEELKEMEENWDNVEISGNSFG